MKRLLNSLLLMLFILFIFGIGAWYGVLFHKSLRDIFAPKQCIGLTEEEFNRNPPKPGDPVVFCCEDGCCTLHLLHYNCKGEWR